MLATWIDVASLITITLTMTITSAPIGESCPIISRKRAGTTAGTKNYVKKNYVRFSPDLAGFVRSTRKRVVPVMRMMTCVYDREMRFF